MKRDRITAGIIAGFIASLVQQIYAWTAKILGFSNADFADFAGILTLFKNYSGTLASVMEWMTHIAIGILCGVLFAVLFMYVSSRYWIVKGLSYGLVLWAVLLGTGTLFKLPLWDTITPLTSLNMLIGSEIFSIVAAFTMKMLDEKTNLI